MEPKASHNECIMKKTPLLARFQSKRSDSCIAALKAVSRSGLWFGICGFQLSLDIVESSGRSVSPEFAEFLLKRRGKAVHHSTSHQ